MASTEIGQIRELVRYPVKSMAGTATESAFLGWHGLLGDRRFAFRRVGDSTGFPWLTASRFPELITYQPSGSDTSSGEPLPTHVLTPTGRRLELRGEELHREIGDRIGSVVELMHLQHGIFDDAMISAITTATVARVCGEAGVGIESRRFRANIVLECGEMEPFAEDGWVGSMFVFGQSATAPAVHITKRDVRCMMINLDPETATQDARVLKAAVRLNHNNAGVYGTVVRTGVIRAGDPVMLVHSTAGTTDP